jgi:uncharacterized protein
MNGSILLSDIGSGPQQRMTSKSTTSWWGIIFTVLLLGACTPSSPLVSSPLTAAPAPILPSPTQMNTVPADPSPTPTGQLLMYPYTIYGLREHDVQGGSVHIRTLLEKTDFYARYLIDYPSDGLTITAIMQIPVQGHPPFPVIIMNHGFFTRASYASGDGTWRAAQYLDQHGYLTLASDYRSWGGSDTGPSLYYSGLVLDVLNLIRAVPSIEQADPSRIGMWGHSMGGGVTLKVLEIDRSIRAAVLYSTVSADDSDLLARWGLGCIGDIAAGELRLGCNSSDIVPLSLPSKLIEAYQASAKDADLLGQISSIDHLDLISAPLQISYGTNDGLTLAGTPPDWSKKLYQSLLDAHKDAALFAYKGEGHSFNGNNWLSFMERSSMFLDQYVKNLP